MKKDERSQDQKVVELHGWAVMSNRTGQPCTWDASGSVLTARKTKEEAEKTIPKGYEKDFYVRPCTIRITDTGFPNEGQDALWLWFELSYASWLTLPRVLMHAMSDEWQGKMAKLLNEFDETFPNVPSFQTEVSLKKDGKYHPVPEWIANYRHPIPATIQHFMAKEAERK